MYLMSRLGLHAKEPEAFIGIAFAYVYTLVDPDIRRCPSVSVRAVLFMHRPYQFYHPFTVDVPSGRWTLFPFIITGTAYTHHIAYVLDGIITGQQVDYFKLFSFKRMYSGSPVSFI